MNQRVYDKLIATARVRTLVTYTDLANIADVDLSGEQAITQLGKILDEIAIEDVKSGRPLLAAVVVRAEDRVPSKGLFKFAKKHGLMKDKDEIGFWSTELRRVYAAWSEKQA